ncbi:MAG: ABC transporter permease [Desulfovibrionaceae bacterium]
MIATSDLVRVSVRQVIRQKSVGVIFSIALGITAFITLSVLGREIRYNIGQDMVLMGGVNIIRMYMDDTQYPGQPRREFFDETIAALRALPGVATVSLNPSYGQTFPLRVGERNLNGHFIAIDQYYGDTYATILYAGREINANDIQQHARVCTLGRDLARDLFGSAKAAVGQLLFLNNDVFEVVGVIGGVMLKGALCPIPPPSTVTGPEEKSTACLSARWGGKTLPNW